MNKNYLYVIGSNPYENAHSDYHTEANGEWNAKAKTIEEALQVIFGSMLFPGEATGRKFFQEGVSLAGVSEYEVIQVWSTEPEAVQRTWKAIKTAKHDGLHAGKGNSFGLHLELKVTDIEKYLAVTKGLLTDAASPSEIAAISPTGAGLVRFHEMKYDMQMAVQQERMELLRREWELESMSNAMELKIKTMEEQMRVLNTYLHGTCQRTVINRGKHGTGKYFVFQARQFLSEEIALLGNFEDFDFKKMEDLEKWLVESGRIWKFLPFERCILATRIRQKSKYYGDPLANLFNNMENMRNMIWIRDGENVCHVDVEFDFHNAVFPDRNQFERALAACLNYIFEESFETEDHPTDWHGEKLEPGTYDIMGQVRRKPLEEEEPYYTQRNVNRRFRTMDDWLKSEFYTELFDKQIREAVHSYLNGVNKRQMIFAVLLQGIVDSTALLEIPKGTDLFNWENIDRYFNLLYEYTHGLPFHGFTDKITPYIKCLVAKGEWIVAYVDEHLPAPKGANRRNRFGTTYKESQPVLLEVKGLEEVEIQKFEKIKVMKPVVHFHSKVRRRWGSPDYGKARSKQPIRLVLKNSDYIRVPMPPSLAEQILDDREWKKEHKWAVPLMLNYRKILSALKAKINCTVLKWDNCDE